MEGTISEKYDLKTVRLQGALGVPINTERISKVFPLIGMQPPVSEKNLFIILGFSINPHPDLLTTEKYFL